MASPMFEMLGNQKQNGFVDFMNQHKGENPNEIINQMMKSGRINQQQLNTAQQKAQQMQGMFNGFRSMFGF